MIRKILPLLLLSLTACGLPSGHIRLEGEFKGIQQAEFYVYSEDGAFDGVDTVAVADGKFAYERPLDRKAVLTLLFPNFSEMHVVAEPGKTVRLSGDAAKLLETEISGTEENELLTAFRLQNFHKPEGNQKMAVADFIHSHPGTWAAMVLFRKYFANAEAPDAATALSLLDAMKKAQPGNDALHDLDNRVRPMLQAGEGQPLPDFTAQTLDGKKLSRADFSGKPLLVCFCASWNNEFQQTLNCLHRLKKAHGSSLGLLAVSLDPSQQVFARQMEHDTLARYAVCEGRAFSSPLALRFGVRYVPGFLLVDKKGIIRKRDMKLSDLEKEIEKLLKN